MLYIIAEEEDEHHPIGVIRLVPPPHEPHEEINGEYDLSHEPYIKLTRVAVLSEYRGLGFARKLVEVALDWAVKRRQEIDDAAAQVAFPGDGEAKSKNWQGLVLVHAQVPVEKMYAHMGFRTDQSLGRWIEEGIEHVGMWRRLYFSS